MTPTLAYTELPSYGRLASDVLMTVAKATGDAVIVTLTGRSTVRIAVDYNTDLGTATGYIVDNTEDEYPDNEVATYHFNPELNIDARSEHALTLVADSVHDFWATEAV